MTNEERLELYSLVSQALESCTEDELCEKCYLYGRTYEPDLVKKALDAVYKAIKEEDDQ